ncbi:conserved hypothetical protein [Desulfamplus magnetovallimortis]|uniref:Sulfotransferase domain-containing protein n=1 Tax=Desulfamplus magnetovallimortis TaxID=1246637 RepID=A0A1W1HDD7_9BACT|nr:sulfotransferase domain-containing protein [Desulfamplus magnetovallimortis]SLM30388.1 conserved hypothetical protein [Desulfamplus magnetovallimortis]
MGILRKSLNSLHGSKSNFIKTVNRGKNINKDIVVVSGLPRSGTSMMMRMLEAGGIEPFIDNKRVPDEDNPNGYYELERIKSLERDNEWLYEAKGKAVKIISMLLYNLPSRYSYKVIFMHRNMDEILLSQSKMLLRKGKNGNHISDKELSVKFFNHLGEIEKWLDNQSNIEFINVSYNDILKEPLKNITNINRFINNAMDESKMVDVLDSALYRQRCDS